jgi:5-methylcytosine-specific restriction endonuclease McrA
MSGPDNIKMVDRLRARDGGLCWLCQCPINFKAESNSDRAPTMEHLIPKCREGSNTIENLVLCHPACNKLLADKPLVDKLKMREERLHKKWVAKLRKRVASLQID